MTGDYDAPEIPVRRVKDFDPDDQPREKALKYGVNSLATADLFALILRTGMPGIPVTDMCRNLMRSCSNSLLELERMNLEDLKLVEGIGTAKALQVLAVAELIRRYSHEKLGEKIKIQSARSIYDVMRSDIGNIPHEEIWALYMDRKLSLLSRSRMSQGSATATVFDVKGILRQAVLLRAEAVALCHNHPSGNLTPSPQDDGITRKFAAACKTMDLRVIDHVIVTADGYYSYAENTRILE